MHDHITWEDILWELAFSAVWDTIVVALLIPLVVKVVKHFVNKDRDRRHGHGTEV